MHAELSQVLGGPIPASGSPTFCFRSDDTTDGLRAIHLDGLQGADIEAEFRLGLTSPEFPFREVASSRPGFLALAFREHPEPLFLVRGGECLFRPLPGWPVAVALFLFHRILASRRDAIFFHAASVGIGGRGVMLVGCKGSGKSTTCLAIAVRGHEFLGDETAGFVPATGELMPMRRPVGIKPGPRSSGLQRGLARAGRNPERDGILRLDVSELLPVPPPRPLPLGAIAFLEPFRPVPEIQEIRAGREEIAQIQPVVGSMLNVSRAQRVFELARMVSQARCYRVAPGEPDATAAGLEEVMASAWQ